MVATTSAKVHKLTNSHHHLQHACKKRKLVCSTSDHQDKLYSLQMPANTMSTQQSSSSSSSQPQFFSEEQTLKLTSHSRPTASHNSTHGTYTPITQSASRDEMIMEKMAPGFVDKQFDSKNKQNTHAVEKEESFECPCGHFHGAGEGFFHHDLGAVGLADFPLLRGPD